MNYITELVKFWRSEDLPIADGVPNALLDEFERQQGVVLPGDFREYFVRVNGMLERGAGCGSRGFTFFPIRDVKPVAKVCEENGLELPEIDHVSQYYVFADYLQWSWAYAIRLDPQENPVVQIGTLVPTVVANSFTEFLKMYLHDDPGLYLPSSG